jgi:hypothetical protein
MMTLTAEQFNENPHGDGIGFCAFEVHMRKAEHELKASGWRTISQEQPERARAGGCKKSVHKRAGWDKMRVAT